MTVRELLEELGECSLDVVVRVQRVNKNLPSKLEHLGEVEELCEVSKPEPGEVILFVKGDEL